MFCPECKAEYRAGFTRCADCDVDLVANQQSCVATCLRLKDAGIPYEVDQRKKQFLKADETQFKIAVPSSYYKHAKELAGRGTLDFSDDPEDQAIMEFRDNA